MEDESTLEGKPMLRLHEKLGKMAEKERNKNTKKKMAREKRKGKRKREKKKVKIFLEVCRKEKKAKKVKIFWIVGDKEKKGKKITKKLKFCFLHFQKIFQFSQLEYYKMNLKRASNVRT